MGEAVTNRHTEIERLKDIATTALGTAELQDVAKKQVRYEFFYDKYKKKSGIMRFFYYLYEYNHLKQYYLFQAYTHLLTQLPTEITIEESKHYSDWEMVWPDQKADHPPPQDWYLNEQLVQFGYKQINDRLSTLLASTTALSPEERQPLKEQFIKELVANLESILLKPSNDEMRNIYLSSIIASLKKNPNTLHVQQQATRFEFEPITFQCFGYQWEYKPFPHAQAQFDSFHTIIDSFHTSFVELKEKMLKKFDALAEYLGNLVMTRPAQVYVHRNDIDFVTQPLPGETPPPDSEVQPTERPWFSTVMLRQRWERRQAPAAAPAEPESEPESEQQGLLARLKDYLGMETEKEYKPNPDSFVLRKLD